MCPSPLGVDRNCASPREPRSGGAVRRVGVRVPAPRECPRRAASAKTCCHRHHLLSGGARSPSARSPPDDKPGSRRFFARLSDESRRRRFLGPKPKLSARELAFLTEVDQCRHVALVAVDRDGRDRRRRPLRDLARPARPRRDGLRGRRRVAGPRARHGARRPARRTHAAGHRPDRAHRLDVRARTRPPRALLRAPRLHAPRASPRASPSTSCALGRRQPARGQPSAPTPAIRSSIAPQALGGARPGARRSAPRSRARRPATSCAAARRPRRSAPPAARAGRRGRARAAPRRPSRRGRRSGSSRSGSARPRARAR